MTNDGIKSQLAELQAEETIKIPVLFSSDATSRPGARRETRIPVWAWLVFYCWRDCRRCQRTNWALPHSGIYYGTGLYAVERRCDPQSQIGASSSVLATCIHGLASRFLCGRHCDFCSHIYGNRCGKISHDALMAKSTGRAASRSSGSV